MWLGREPGFLHHLLLWICPLVRFLTGTTSPAWWARANVSAFCWLNEHNLKKTKLFSWMKFHRNERPALFSGLNHLKVYHQVEASFLSPLPPNDVFQCNWALLKDTTDTRERERERYVCIYTSKRSLRQSSCERRIWLRYWHLGRKHKWKRASSERETHRGPGTSVTLSDITCLHRGCFAARKKQNGHISATRPQN